MQSLWGDVKKKVVRRTLDQCSQVVKSLNNCWNDLIFRARHRPWVETHWEPLGTLGTILTQSQSLSDSTSTCLMLGVVEGLTLLLQICWPLISQLEMKFQAIQKDCQGQETTRSSLSYQHCRHLTWVEWNDTLKAHWGEARFHVRSLLWNYSWIACIHLPTRLHE